MTDKDPKDMTVSELLRKAGNGYEGASGTVMMNLIDLMGLSRKIRHSECLYALADKIDAELAQARELSLRQGAELWAKANGWPDFRDGEDFGAWLERCALKLPCDKDGEPWSIGDRVMPGNRSESTVTGYSFNGADWFLEYRWCGIDSYANEFATSCKRPAPEVLGADGKPIKVGETMYPIDGEWIGIPLGVSGIESPASVKVYLSAGKSWTTFHADRLTHTPPDTQERIDEDAEKFHCVYFGGYSACGTCPASTGELSKKSCKQQQIFDLLRRQRELDKRKGGAE